MLQCPASQLSFFCTDFFGRLAQHHTPLPTLFPLFPFYIVLCLHDLGSLLQTASGSREGTDGVEISDAAGFCDRNLAFARHEKNNQADMLGNCLSIYHTWRQGKTLVFLFFLRHGFCVWV